MKTILGAEQRIQKTPLETCAEVGRASATLFQLWMTERRHLSPWLEERKVLTEGVLWQTRMQARPGCACRRATRTCIRRSSAHLTLNCVPWYRWSVSETPNPVGLAPFASCRIRVYGHGLPCRIVDFDLHDASLCARVAWQHDQTNGHDQSGYWV